MNLLRGEIVGTVAQTRLKVAEGGGTIVSDYPFDADDMGASVSVGIRPEDLITTDAADFAFEGMVEIKKALGEVTLLYFGKTSPKYNALIGKFPGIHNDVRGRKMRLSVGSEKAHVFKRGILLHYRDQDGKLRGVASD
jgi:alpha-glucoside transport system ATP-binding protein